VARNPYAVLGVAKDASADDIQKAYRKLAKELHPDLNPGNTKSADRFKEISGAYALLRDPKTRARFDRGEIDEQGAEKPQKFYRDFADSPGARTYHTTSGFDDLGGSSDLFADLFGRARQGKSGPRKGQDALFRLEVDFADAVKGATQRITLPDGGTLDVRIPEGTREGQILRLKGKGMRGAGGAQPGDALVEISVRAHPHFARKDDDILLELPITVDEAVLGAKIETPTIWGPVALTVPPGASSGQILRLRGKGVPGAGRKPGDQLVSLRIVMPSAIDDELAAFMRTWRTGHHYDPRAKIKAAP